MHMLKAKINGMPTVDPVLEGVRGRALVEEATKRKRQEKEADKLVTSLNRVHASFLFLRKHEKAVQQFCRHLDATPAHIQNNSWNALVVELGLDDKIIGCVNNMREVSYTELILKSYASMPEASLGNLVKAVKKIERVDALAALQENLEEISLDHGGHNQNEDSGFSSLDTESGNEPQMRLIYPDFTDVRSQWKKGLPFTLRHLEGGDRLQQGNDEERTKIYTPSRGRHREENRVQGAAVISRDSIPRVTGNSPRPADPTCKVFITFAEDGASLAKDIAKFLRTRNGKRPQIGVLLLDEHWDKVQRNPEDFIMHWFEKVNYVVPILTEGYLKSIRKKRKNASGSELELTGSSLDVEYVPYIKDLANKYYTANSCINDKIRCIVPIDKRKVLNHMRCKVDPLMKAYVYDTEVEGLAKRMTETFDGEEE